MNKYYLLRTLNFYLNKITTALYTKLRGDEKLKEAKYIYFSKDIRNCYSIFFNAHSNIRFDIVLRLYYFCKIKVKVLFILHDFQRIVCKRIFAIIILTTLKKLFLMRLLKHVFSGM